MSISYKKLWKLLIDKEMMKKDLQREAGISWASVTKMSKGEVVGTEILMKVCKTLHCDIGDIVEFIEDDNYKKEKNKKEESKVEHNENVKEKEKKNIDDNYSDEFEKIEVGDLQEINNEDENNKKYNDFES